MKKFTTQNFTKKVTVPFTVRYKDGAGNLGRNTDHTVRTFTCAAVDETDAIRQLSLHRTFIINVDGYNVKKVNPFRVITAFHGDGISRCTCNYCKKNPSFAPKVTVLKPAKMPRWMR
jgi:hypothetical protein